MRGGGEGRELPQGTGGAPRPLLRGAKRLNGAGARALRGAAGHLRNAPGQPAPLLQPWGFGGVSGSRGGEVGGGLLAAVLQSRVIPSQPPEKRLSFGTGSLLPFFSVL